MSRIAGWGFALACCWAVAPAEAVVVSVDPAAQDAPVGQDVIVDLKIGGLSPQSVAAFDLDVLFDPLILGLSQVQLGDPVLGDQLDLNGAGSLFGSGLLPGGHLNIFELSGNGPGELDQLQADEFILARITLKSLGPGTSSVALQLNAFGDAVGDPLAAALVPGAVTVIGDGTGGVIPEPSNMVLCVIGLAAAVTRRRQS